MTTAFERWYAPLSRRARRAEPASEPPGPAPRPPTAPPLSRARSAPYQTAGYAPSCPATKAEDRPAYRPAPLENCSAGHHTPHRARRMDDRACPLRSRTEDTERRSASAFLHRPPGVVAAAPRPAEHPARGAAPAESRRR